jgi:hypothetical protein
MLDLDLNARVRALGRSADLVCVRSVDDLAAVRRLRYRCYLHEGAIAPDPSESFGDEFDHSENGEVFAIRLDGQFVASIRIHVARTPKDPSVVGMIFPEIVGPALRQGVVFVDPTRFVIDREASRLAPDLKFLVLSIPYGVAAMVGADLVYAAVRAEHMPFYRRYIFCRELAPPRDYFGLTKRLGLMASEFSSAEARAKYPFLELCAGMVDRAIPADHPWRVAGASGDRGEGDRCGVGVAHDVAVDGERIEIPLAAVSDEHAGVGAH